MKNRFIKITALLLSLCVIAMSSGCSCAGANQLTFNKNFLGGNVTSQAQAGYKEKTSYKVKLASEYEDISKITALDDYVEYDYNGVYTMEFSAGVPLPDEASSNIPLPEGAHYYQLVTKLELDAFYKLKVEGDYPEGGTDEDGGKTYKDTVTTTSYFLPEGHSFAPIYSTTSQKSTVLNFNGEAVALSQRTYSTVTTFDKDSYKTFITTPDGETDFSSDYDYRAVIDNTQLLFALRCIDVAVDGTFSLSVATPSYQSPQTISVQNRQEKTVQVKVNDDEPKNYSVKTLAISLNDQYNRGTAQYALVSTTSSETPNNKSMLVEYAYPLITYASFAQMGALVYTLNATEYHTPQ